jgi:hypothetical protein
VKGREQTLTFKARSVQASFYSSYVLYDNRKVYHAGPEASTNSENIYFKQLNYEPKVDN